MIQDYTKLNNIEEYHKRGVIGNMNETRNASNINTEIT